jgi:hypothetical protein
MTYVTSETDIANLALDLLSAGTIQDVVNPTTAAEEVVSRWYDITRLKVLREHPWNFAAKRAIVAASSTSPEYGYTYAFPIPNDFVRLLTIQNSDGADLQASNYEMEYVGSQRCILYNAEGGSLRMRYVHDITDVTKFDPSFIHLLAHEIALAIAYKVTESNGNVDRINSIKDEIKRIAKSIDGQERPPTLVRYSKTLAARRNYGGRTDRVTFE